MTQSAIRMHPAPMTKAPSKTGAGKANAKPVSYTHLTLPTKA